MLHFVLPTGEAIQMGNDSISKKSKHDNFYKWAKDAKKGEAFDITASESYDASKTPEKNIQGLKVLISRKIDEKVITGTIKSFAWGVVNGKAYIGRVDDIIMPKVEDVVAPKEA